MKQALKLAEAKGRQDLFGRLLFLSFQQKIDVSTVYEYPTVPEPHCFTYPNGALRDNPKFNVCKMLKGMVNTEAPQNSNAVAKSCFFCFVWFMLWCLWICIKDTKRHKKEERGNEEFDRVFYIGPKTKMEIDMYDLL